MPDVLHIFRHRAARAAARVTFVATLAALAACGGGGAIRERLRPASPREAYAAALREAGLDRTALGRDWAAAGARAAATPAAAPLPAREQGSFAAGEAHAVAWRVRPRRGQRVTVRVEADADSGARLFHDLVRQPGGDTAAARLVEAGEGLRAAYQLDADAPDDAYVFRLQPELLRAVRWTVTFEVGPSLAFPVQGRTSRAVQSFWGADRDGGARRHQGIDIFAPRGTPALAAADGVVGWVGENRLGGQVVFVHDPARGHSLYYAHLDRQAVATGQRVRAGDTVGFVGNSGNARGTAPHLHFGVYRAGEGAVDPFPYVDTRAPAPPAAPARAATLVGRPARTGARPAALRAGPAAAAPAALTLAPHTVVAVDGAAGGAGADAWLRVRLPDGRAGYVAAAAVEEATRPLATTRLAAAASVRARPAPNAPAVRVTAAPASARVLGRFPGYAWVELDDGARGWVAGD